MSKIEKDMLAATRLLGQIGQIFRDHSIPPANPDGIRIDSKRREMLREKLLAMGQRDEQEQGMHFSY